MRLIPLIILMALVPVAQARAQDSAPKQAPAKQEQKPADKAGATPKAKSEKAATKPKKAKSKKAAAKEEAAPPPPATPAMREAYAAMPVAERVAIQSDLVWSGDLTGSLDPDFGDRAIAAVRSFQKRNALKDTGILTPEERQTLADATRKRKDYIGWRLVEDSVTPGVRLGVPGKLVPLTELGTTGSRWSSARGEIQIETFREKMAGTTLAELFEEMKKKPSNRRVETSSIQTHSFALYGLQGLKRFHVRVHLKDNEARGITILFDQAMEGIMEPLVERIASAFIPFGLASTASTARKVEYGSGMLVTRDGHVVTKRQLTEGCHAIIVARLGRAERLADDTTADFVLLCVNGAGNLKPLAFSDEAPKSTDLTLVGIADPDLQAGARNVTTANAKLRGVDGSRVLLDATPARGFAGAVALDGQGQLAGMVDVSPATAATTQASLVPTATIRKFLGGAGVTPANGRGDLASAKNALVRVICVRK